MPEENWKDFIKKRHIEYKKIGHIECPAFDNERIYFNKHGFNHLVRKNGKLRSPFEQVRRTSLLYYAVAILQRAHKSVSYSINEVDGLPGHFWTFYEKVNDIKIKVVVRKLNDGRIHFFSVMDCL